ncbi:MAG TPA: hypothetical protein VJT73_21250 [Polyangiaceae bacterium]|nr:hypothetical protein [Polyangiaceae bacterium]
MRWSLPWSLSLLAIPLACTRATERDGASRIATPAQVLYVGDRVVVEHAIATFVEGTVLSIFRDRAKVQLIPSGDIAEQPISEVYVPSPSHTNAVFNAFAPAHATEPGHGKTPLGEGSYAVCHMPDGVWRGCRIEAAGSPVRVVDDGATVAELSWQEILAPTAVTELNVRQRFERNAKRRAFREGARNAGRPRSPASWRPALSDRIIAEREGNFVTARIRSQRKGILRIQWDSDQKVAEVALADAAPEPPVAFVATAGNYVLVRPVASAKPWSVMRVESAGSETLVLSDELGIKRYLPMRDVIPLERK